MYLVGEKNRRRNEESFFLFHGVQPTTSSSTSLQFVSSIFIDKSKYGLARPLRRGWRLLITLVDGDGD